MREILSSWNEKYSILSVLIIKFFLYKDIKTMSKNVFCELFLFLWKKSIFLQFGRQEVESWFCIWIEKKFRITTSCWWKGWLKRRKRSEWQTILQKFPQLQREMRKKSSQKLFSFSLYLQQKKKWNKFPYQKKLGKINMQIKDKSEFLDDFYTKKMMLQDRTNEREDRKNKKNNFNQKKWKILVFLPFSSKMC